MDLTSSTQSSVLGPGPPSVTPLGNNFLERFEKIYQGPHGWVSLILCCMGILTNCVNIIVLTRPRMVNAVNVTLTFIACCDALLMSSQMACALIERILFPNDCLYEQRWSYAWVLFRIIHGHFSVWAHATSLWLAVFLSVARFKTLNTKGPSIWNSTKYMIKAAVATGLLCLVISLPSFLMFEIEEAHLDKTFDPSNQTDTGSDNCIHMNLYSPADLREYNLTEEDIANILQTMTDKVLYRQKPSMFYSKELLQLAMWDFGLLHKVAPCILLTVFMCLLLQVLFEANKRRQRLLGQRACPRGILKRFQSRYVMMGADTKKFEKTGTFITDRTTAMLIFVVFIFVICELPQGILVVMCAVQYQASGVIGGREDRCLYVVLGDLLDILSLSNSCINFVLYCIMSQRFRTVFTDLFIIPLPCIQIFAKAEELTSNGRNSAVDLIIRARTNAVYKATGQAIVGGALPNSGSKILFEDVEELEPEMRSLRADTTISLPRPRSTSLRLFRKLKKDSYYNGNNSDTGLRPPKLIDYL